MVDRAPEVLAIVPARGGSKGIPRKNVRPLGGHPLLGWSIAAGRQSKLVRRVLVSTEDREIAAVARAYGAETPFLRPPEIALDDTLDLPVFEHALEWLERHDGYRPDIVVQLRPTSPLRPPGLVDQAIEILLSDDRADSVRGVTSPAQNPYKMWTISHGVLEPLVSSRLHEPYNAPRQSLPETYWQTGHIDVFRRDTVARKRSMTGDCILPLMIASRYAVDIDSAIHWQIAEAVLASGELAVVEPERTMGANLEGIRLLVFDFDGVFTDNTVITTQDGAEAVICSREDGLGIERLLSRGIDAAVLSTEENPVVAARCRKLKLSFVQGLSDKGQGLRDLASTKGLGVDQVAYVGNDRNDLECLKIARVALVPADAHPSIRGMADVVLRHRGGHGAVREACELAIAAHNGGEAHERTANR